MEGYLQKRESFFQGWLRYYFILHEDTLLQLSKKEGKLIGSIHMKIATIQNDSKDRLLITIFNGTSEVYLRANSIKETVDWTNALINCQKQCLEGRYDQFKKKSTIQKGSTPQKEADSPFKESPFE